MAAITLAAEPGDTLDALLWRRRGMGPDDLGEVLALNPGLAAIGAELPAGTPVLVPDRSEVAPRRLDIVQLWD